MNRLVFQSRPAAVIGSNTFIDVPILIEINGEPLVEVVQDIKLKWTTQVPIYDEDSNYIAKVVGTRVVPGPDWQKGRLSMRHPQGGQHICSLDGRELFELRRNGAAGFSMTAELYAPHGRFLRFGQNVPLEVCAIQENSLVLLGQTALLGNTISGFRVGVSIEADGSIVIGKN
jgi:hypothetical protein